VTELESVLDELVARAPVARSSWNDVVARARRARRKRLALATAAAVAVVTLEIPALGIGGRLTDVFSGSPVSTEELSPEQLHVLGAMAAGVTPRLPASAKESLARVQSANLRRIATREGTSYYVADREGGGLCVTIVRPDDRTPFSGYLCSPDFPSPEQPIADESVFGSSPAAPVIRRLEGFAADGVARVELVTVDGTHVDAEVEDNVYLRTNDLPHEIVCEIDARAADGSVIYKSRLIRGCAG
jgi:hypothetical protein